MNAMPKQIAFIDDEITLTAYYVDALSAIGYAPTHFKSPDSCLSSIRAGKTFDLFVTDLMMPSYGVYTKTQTSDGLKTGVIFTKELREIEPETPIIVLTNLNVEAIFAEVQTELSEIPNVFVVQKAQFTPSRLAESVQALLEDGLPPIKRAGILRRFWDSLLLQPNFMGMGIKIKTLLGVEQ